MKKRTIGILGASANPLHEGHLASTQAALSQITNLDEVWIMVSPQNPEKDPASYVPIEHRLHLAHLAVRQSDDFGCRIKVSDFEVQLRRFGVPNHTVHMLEEFVDSYKDLQPVWLMGADNLGGLHTWGERWMEIMQNYPVGVFNRPGYEQIFTDSPAAKEFSSAFQKTEEFFCKPGTWTKLDASNHPASATKIRTSIKLGELPRYLTPEAISYIKEQQLFVGS